MSFVDVSGLCCCTRSPPLQEIVSVVTLAPNKIFSIPSYTYLCPVYASIFFVPIIFKSSSTSSAHLFSVLPILFVLSVFAVNICFCVVSLFVLSICPYNLNLKDFIHFKISALQCILCPLIWSYSPVFLFFYGNINFSYSFPFGWFCSLH